LPQTVDEMIESFSNLFIGFERNTEYLRASRFSKPAAEARARRKVKQREAVLRSLGDLIEGMDEREARKVGAIVHLLGGSEAWLLMHDVWDLDGAEAGSAVRWAYELLIEALKRRSGHKPNKNSANRKTTDSENEKVGR
jgi:hypothetical protein